MAQQMQQQSMMGGMMPQQMMQGQMGGMMPQQMVQGQMGGMMPQQMMQGQMGGMQMMPQQMMMGGMQMINGQMMMPAVYIPMGSNMGGMQMMPMVAAATPAGAASAAAPGASPSCGGGNATGVVAPTENLQRVANFQKFIKKKQKHNVQVVFVGGLRKTTEEDRVTAHFAKFGQVENVDIKRLPDGTSRGFAFVKFADSDAIEKVMEAHAKHMIDNKWVEVKRHDGMAACAGRAAAFAKEEVDDDGAEDATPEPGTAGPDDWEETWSAQYLAIAQQLGAMQQPGIAPGGTQDQGAVSGGANSQQGTGATAAGGGPVSMPMQGQIAGAMPGQMMAMPAGMMMGGGMQMMQMVPMGAPSMGAQGMGTQGTGGQGTTGSTTNMSSSQDPVAMASAARELAAAHTTVRGRSRSLSESSSSSCSSRHHSTALARRSVSRSRSVQGGGDDCGVAGPGNGQIVLAKPTDGLGGVGVETTGNTFAPVGADDYSFGPPSIGGGIGGGPVGADTDGLFGPPMGSANSLAQTGPGQMMDGRSSGAGIGASANGGGIGSGASFGGGGVIGSGISISLNQTGPGIETGEKARAAAAAVAAFATRAAAHSRDAARDAASAAEANAAVQQNQQTTVRNESDRAVSEALGDPEVPAKLWLPDPSHPQMKPPLKLWLPEPSMPEPHVAERPPVPPSQPAAPPGAARRSRSRSAKRQSPTRRRRPGRGGWDNEAQDKSAAPAAAPSRPAVPPGMQPMPRPGGGYQAPLNRMGVPEATPEALRAAVLRAAQVEAAGREAMAATGVLPRGPPDLPTGTEVIEQKCVAYLIGRGGQALAAINAASGVSINIDQSTKQYGYSMANIYGTEEGATKAKMILRQKVAEYRPLRS